MPGLALALALAAVQADGPPVSAAACFDGRCIRESFPRTPYIVFFAQDADRLDAEGAALVTEFAAQRRWWPHLVARVCVAADDPLADRRLRHLRELLRRAGYRRVPARVEGRDCPAFASRRARTLTGYQLTLDPA